MLDTILPFLREDPPLVVSVNDLAKPIRIRLSIIVALSKLTAHKDQHVTWELEQNVRIVTQNESWVALVPFWAGWPYEVLIAPTKTRSRIEELSDLEIGDSDILHNLREVFRYVASLGYHLQRDC